MKATPFLLLAIAVGAGFAYPSLQEATSAPASPETAVSSEFGGGVTVLGQTRASFSSWLWAKTDVYLHNGSEMRKLTESEKARGLAGVVCDEDHEHGAGEASEADHDHEHSGEEEDDHHHEEEGDTTTVIPGPNLDFRGVLGDIEREVKPYADLKHHQHNDPKDTLPLFRLMTAVDPAFVPGWVTGASVYARGGDTGVRQAVNFLKEGLRKNPKSVPILAELGRLQAAKIKDSKAALAYFERALQIPTNPQHWTEFESDSYLQVFRWTALSLRDQRRIRDMRSVLDSGRKLFPDDPLLLRLNGGDAPLVLKPEYRDEWMEKNPIRGR